MNSSEQRAGDSYDLTAYWKGIEKTERGVCMLEILELGDDQRTIFGDMKRVLESILKVKADIESIPPISGVYFRRRLLFRALREIVEGTIQASEAICISNPDSTKRSGSPRDYQTDKKGLEDLPRLFD